MPSRTPSCQMDPLALVVREAVDSGLLTIDRAHELEAWVRGQCGGQRWYIARWQSEWREIGLPRPGRFLYRRTG